MIDFDDIDIDETRHDIVIGVSVEIMGSVNGYYKYYDYYYYSNYKPYRVFFNGVYKVTDISSRLINGGYRKLYKLSTVSGYNITDIFWYDIGKFEHNVL